MIVTHESLEHVREQYVLAYSSYLIALSGVLSDQLLTAPVVYPNAPKRVASLTVDLRVHLRNTLQPLKDALYSIVDEALSAEGKSASRITLRDFASDLFDEAVDGVMRRADQDRQLIVRIASEAVLVGGLPNQKSQLMTIRQFVAKKQLQSKASDRQSKSLNVVRAAINSALYRAYNESKIYLATTESVMATYPSNSEKASFEFKCDDYYRDDSIRAKFHPNSNALVLVI